MKPVYKTLSIILLLTSGFGFKAQNEFSKWYFGQLAGLDFANSPPTVLTNGIIGTAEGVATISDSNGNLLFYTDGLSVSNSAHTLMANGSGLSGNQSSTQAAVIVKQPGNLNIYYIFTTSPVGANGVMYSIVDVSLAAGMGSVTVKNATLYVPTCEKQVVVRHCNGRDIWVVTHDYNSNQFRTFLLNSTGISSSPVISAIGEVPNGAASAIGQIKISPDGKKLASATLTNSTGNPGIGGFHLFDFDAASGIVSNSLTLLSGSATANINTGAYGVEFSPDGTKLFGTTSPGLSSNPTPSCALFQWNICAANNQAIVASQYSVVIPNPGVGSIQRAIDGKIYIAPNASQSLHVINNPNSSGAGMNFVLNGQSIAPKQSRLGLPNYINPYIRTIPVLFTNTITCQTTSFSIPPVPSFSSGCSSTPYSPNSYLWDFGEGTSGAANSSTLTSPVHTYSNTGTYSVSLILYGNCTNDTLQKIITISTPGPSITVAGTYTICKGEKHTYTVSGGNSYQWSNNTTAPTATLAPTTTSVYSATAMLNGCSATKQFTITVNPCLGIGSNEGNSFLRIFPNPAKNFLAVLSKIQCNVTIFDLAGSKLLEGRINPGNNELNISILLPGIYIIQLESDKNLWHGRFIKMD